MGRHLPAPIGHEDELRADGSLDLACVTQDVSDAGTQLPKIPPQR
jgi:hypothetical protein